jgi:uncharacterized protein
MSASSELLETKNSSGEPTLTAALWRRAAATDLTMQTAIKAAAESFRADRISRERIALRGVLLPLRKRRLRRTVDSFDSMPGQAENPTLPARGWGRIRVRVSRIGLLALRWRILIAAAVAVLGICLILLALAWRASNELMHFGPSEYAWNLSDYPALAKVVEPLKVRSSTGVTLVGRFFPGRDDATVVLSHGYGGDEDEILPVANALHAAGFTVVTYNERSRDGSGGEGTWGVLETVDLRSVINAVVRHAHVNPDELGEFGFSIGADISIMEAAADKRVKAVAAAGSWPTLAGYMKSRLSDVILHPRSPYSPLALWLMQLRTGVDLSTVRPVDYIARISPRPIFLIQGLDDTDVNPHSAIVNYDHARAPRSLWMVKGEGHEDLVKPGGAASSQRVIEFFEHALLPARHHRA